MFHNSRKKNISRNSLHTQVAKTIKQNLPHTRLLLNIVGRHILSVSDVYFQVLEQVRAMVANRLGHCGRSWSKTFALYNSGTYNNQWMVVDYKRFKKGKHQSQLSNNLLWVLEQLPGHTRAEDKTEVLRKQSYWPSYNTPYFPDIYNLSGSGELAAKYGDW
jgi:hypothetical protein